MCLNFSKNMKYFVLALVLCSGFLFQNGSSRELESQEQLLDEKKINLDEEAYFQENNVIEDPFPNNAACVCGPPGSFKGICKFEGGIKRCECAEGFAMNEDKCEACVCGPSRSFKGICKFDLGIKRCECEEGFAMNKDKCEACVCGPPGTFKGMCKFDGGIKSCECEKGFAMNKDKCEECFDCGVNGSCYFVNGRQDCRCDLGFGEIEMGKKKECIDCDGGCGVNGSCYFVNGRQNCRCDHGFGTIRVGNKTECIECDCGNGYCFFELGRKVCMCLTGFKVKDGKCTECDCGPISSCQFINGQKTCQCPGFLDKYGICTVKLCRDGNECEYPLICEKYFGKKACKRKRCYIDDDECDYPMKCFKRTFEERKTCSLEKCENENDCEFPLKCLDIGDADGKVCTHCDCGAAGACTFQGAHKKCTCAPFSTEIKGKCIECDCGPHGLCFFELDQKKCVCSPYSTEKDGKCVVTETSTLVTSDSTSLMTTILTSTVSTCYCGPATEACFLDSSGDKNCSCFSGYVPVNGYCAECKCGPYGRCIFENGQKKCICMPFAIEVNGVCVDFGTTSEGTTDSPITSTFVSSTVQECDCGSRGRCTFEKGQKKCICDPFTSKKDGKCVDCYCGENSKSCHFNWNGDKICNCTSGYSQVSGFCFDCNCGINTRSCFYKKDGDKVCNCDFGYIQTNRHCSAICSKDKCVHGKCEIVENGYKCRCNEGFTGQRCEEKIPIKPNKQDLWMVMIVSGTFAIFVLLSGMFGFLTHILSKISKK